ncbi:MAG: hypothetical protein M3T56_01925, partial [Chloroflexota bacterium]|nr:hypothetical protein [Chloroflexota bacterium]
MTVTLRPSIRWFALIPTLVVVCSVAVDFALIDVIGIFFVGVVSLLTFVGVGLLLTLRLPRQPVGWLLLGAGTLFQLTMAAPSYAWVAFIGAPGTLPLGEVALLVTYAWMPALGCVFLAMILFPTGKPPSARWHIPVALVVLSTALQLAAALVTTSELPVPLPSGIAGVSSVVVRNSLAIGGPLGSLLAFYLQSPLAYMVGLIPIAAVFVRFRTAAGKERQQLKWFAYTSVIAMLFLVVSSVLPLFSYMAGTGPVVLIGAIDLIPISIAIAILRYRLYDIDLLIKRTIVYGATSAAIATTFFVGIVALQGALRQVTSGSELAIAASTLLSFALFQPIRRRVQDMVNRRFDRSRFDAA